MTEHRIFGMPFARIYPLYVNKVERKGRTVAELDEVLTWLTGYDEAGLRAAVDSGVDMRGFFDETPSLNANVDLITVDAVLAEYHRQGELEEKLEEAGAS